jgi:hypothetical protein
MQFESKLSLTGIICGKLDSNTVSGGGPQHLNSLRSATMQLGANSSNSNRTQFELKVNSISISHDLQQIRF